MQHVKVMSVQDLTLTKPNPDQDYLSGGGEMNKRCSTAQPLHNSFRHNEAQGPIAAESRM